MIDADAGLGSRKHRVWDDEVARQTQGREEHRRHHRTLHRPAFPLISPGIMLHNPTYDTMGLPLVWNWRWAIRYHE